MLQSFIQEEQIYYLKKRLQEKDKTISEFQFQLVYFIQEGKRLQQSVDEEKQKANEKQH